MFEAWKKFNSYLTTLAGGLLAFVMILIVVDVILRITVNSPIAGVVDLVSVLIPIFTFLPLAHAEILEDHIRVEVFTNLMTARKQLALDVLASICGIIILGLFAWQGWDVFYESWQNAEYYPGLYRIRIYPAKFVLALGFTLFGVHLLIKAIIGVKLLFAKTGNTKATA